MTLCLGQTTLLIKLHSFGRLLGCKSLSFLAFARSQYEENTRPHDQCKNINDAAQNANRQKRVRIRARNTRE